MNSLDLISERQCASIYRAFEARNLSRAVVEADKLIKKQPALHLASALKALALAQLRKNREANAVCDHLLGLKQTFSPAVVLPLTHALSSLDRDLDQVHVLDATSKAHPEAEDVADQCFSALIKAKLYQRAQQTAQRMHKAFKKDLYFWWSIQAYELLASRQPQAQGAALALPLCERMITQHLKAKPLTGKSDELVHLYLTILHKAGKDKQALEILSPSSEVGTQLCKRSLALELMRRELWSTTGAWAQLREEAKSKLNAGERDWAYVYALCQSSAKLDQAANAQAGCPSLKEARQFLQERLYSDGFTRVGSLAYLESFAQQRLLSADKSLSTDTQSIIRTAIEAHLDAFGNKACGAGDVMPYLLELLSTSELEALHNKFMDEFKPFDGRDSTADELARQITSIRLLQAIEARTQAASSFHATDFASRYIAGLPVGASLPETEGQPADELGMLTAQRLLSESPNGDLATAIESAAFLLYTCQRSKKGYRLRVFLVKILLQLGLFTKATDHWDHLKAAFIQHDTLGHLILDRASVFGHIGGVDAAEVTERLRLARTVYTSNDKDTNEMVQVAFQNGTFSKIEEVVDFGQRVDRSLSRQIYRLEQAKLALTGHDGSAQPSASGALASVRSNVEAVLDTLREGPLCDQRDFTVLPAAHASQPHFRPDEHTLLGPMTSEADILADAGVLAVAGGIALHERELDALRIYQGESKALVVFALALHDFESGKATADQLKGGLDNFLAERAEAIGRAELPWRALQQSGLVLEAISVVKLVQHRANERKDADAVSALQNILDSTRPQLKQSVEALQAATKRIGDVAQTGRDRIRQSDSVLSVISGTAGTGSQRQKDEGTALLLGGFVENLLEKMESSLADAAREFKTRLGFK
ncbi:unnamed protein product [Tilletia laevis]|uniref:Actin cytoskeleton organization protein n=3 Tax=Tilletia TaxID=13289 RepID=A0A8X7MPI2_9BASI|nr:hypothetical protein CF336_g5611 [Tilletia laevis]KAE8243929.1 hypothetical protein A4X06_0g6053 [Tilletia controversa]KAE8257183.1 hypothetical protein A4X03_0g4756 [Tilletia caries]KAE8205160.1 hypothetical protein CF335_g2401 [Tilletia laevis]CAD6888654.1 unnamed protein product [Tilletia caries]